MAKKTKETKGERITKALKKQFKLTVIMLSEDFALIEERNSVIHLCDDFFIKPDGCDSAYIKDCKDSAYIKDCKVCEHCGAEIPKKYQCIDKIFKLEV